VTHACFKALLFLAAGVVIQGLNEEHNMFKMGGLRRVIPGTFWAFIVGAASLSALPLVTAGFYSKDLIIMEAWSSQAGSGWLWLAGLVGALLTSLYAFRMVFLTFFGEAKTEFHKRADITMKIPLAILALLSIVAGFIETPQGLGNMTLFSDFMETALPALPTLPTGSLTVIAKIAVPIISLIGLYLAYLLFVRRPGWVRRATETPVGSLLHAYWLSGWGFDWLYSRLIVRPFVRMADWNRQDAIDLVYDAVAGICMVSSDALALTQTGKIRWYAAAITVGVLIFIAIVVLG
jgi:NADH-quinone oxidoreductase subunit L